MIGFVDEATITVASGNGGDGAVSFRREKYIPRGGPDGGDGGRGGSVVFFIKKNVKTLAHLKHKRIFRAKDGENGHGRKMHGEDAPDIMIPVPPGTIIRDPSTNEVLKDFADEEGSWTFLTGGNGGFGNVHFMNSVRQAPEFAKPGQDGEERIVVVEINIIADIGFIGYPNTGKSSLLKALTNAHPKIADYPFTTKIPNLGVLHSEYEDIILADIPGIIKGASMGVGLGLKFLKHISRTKGLAFLIDLSEIDFDRHLDDLFHEVRTYSESLMDKKRIIIGTKMDIEGTEENLKYLQEKYPDENIIGISSWNRHGLEELSQAFRKLAVVKNENSDPWRKP